MVERIGVRELRQHASRYVERAASGQRIEVTNHGRLVALLVPAGEDPLARLEAGGRLSRARGEVHDLPSAARPAPGHPTASDSIAAMREEER